MSTRLSRSRTSYFSPLGLALLAIALCVGKPARAQVGFPDPQLESAVRNALNISGLTPITESNMLTLTNLSAAFDNIRNLAGLNTASNLVTLDLGFNQLTDLSPLTNLTQLTQLHAGWNPLANCAPLAALTNLTYLDLNSDQLTNIAPLAGLKKLTLLVFPWNHVLEVSPLASLTNLAWLDLGGNRGLSSGAISNVTALTSLHQLQWLSLYDLTVSDLSPLTALTSLTNLDVSWNGTPTNFNALNGLTNLWLLHVTADTVSNLLFVAHMPRLQDLDFGYNNVADLSPAVGRHLTSLMAYFNSPLTNAFLVTNFPALQHLSLGGDGLTQVTFVAGLTNLQELWLDNNPDLANLTPVLGLTNLWHLDVDNDALTNLAAVVALPQLNNLEMNGVTTRDLSFLAQLVNLNSLDLGLDDVGSLVVLTNLPFLNNLYLNTDFVTDPTPLLLLPNLGYVDLTYNLLDTNTNSAAFNVISNLQNVNFVTVEYAPQNLSPTLTVLDSPNDVCIPINGLAYFAGAASTSSGNTLTYQWQFNGTDLAGQTNDFLLLTRAVTNLAGAYRVIFGDGNGYAASASANCYIGDTNCGRTLTIVQQPLNVVAAPGDDVTFSVVATTTLTNLYYQWLFDGTNVSAVNASGANTNTLDLSGVDYTNTGIYQVLVWDDSSNVLASTAVQLVVLTVVPFTDPNVSNQVVNALGLAPGATVQLTDLDNLNYLDLSYLGVTNLTGLQYARNLYTLNLDGDPISDPTPIGWIYTLNNLYVSGCGLQDASFVSGLGNLINLDLSYNPIHEIPDLSALGGTLSWLQLNYDGPLIYYARLASLTNLTSLSIHDDGVADLAFATGMTQLNSLDAGGDYSTDPNLNTISDISPLLGKTQMNWLSLSFDQVTNIPVIAAFTNLGSLYLSSNHFGNLNFIANLPNLSSFSINDSTVTNVSTLTNHALLNWLDVSYTLATDLSSVSGLTNLGTLWSGGNHTHTAAYVTGLTNLSWLGLEWNGITNLAPLAALSNLYYLQLENNALTDVSVLAPKTNLNSLYLSGNQLRDLTPLAGLTHLQWLSLSGNGFTNVAPLASVTALVWLEMQSNAVQDVSAFIGLTNLYYGLDLSVNQLTNLAPLTNLHRLTSLEVWQNNLTTLPSLLGLSNVTSLDFSRNQLTNGSGVSGMTQLTWLSFNQNNFTAAPLLTGLPNLNSLDLGNNRLSDVSTLASLNSLNWLYLYNNTLGSIHPLTSLTHLYYTDVRNNWLDIYHAGSPALADIATLQGYGTYVDYNPQNSLLLGSPVMLAAHQWQFPIYSPPGDVLQVFQSGDLNSWTALGTFTNTGGTNLFTDTNAMSAVRFYRALQ